jgi:2-polyprenyl-3-methyl-5-hydroxy-6-metoxy-1,4-benzoquinol methylase
VTERALIHACKLCGSARFRPKYELRRLQLTVFECPDCGLRFVGDDLSAAHIQGMYNRDGVGRYVRATQALHEQKFAPHVAELAANGVQPPARILDLGCGGGEFPEAVAQAGYRAVGIDISEPSIRAARELHPRIDFRVASAEEIAVEEPHAFAAVTLWDVIEHAHDPHAVVEAARRTLEPGGLLGIGTPNGESIYDVLLSLVYPTRTPLADRMMEQRFSDWHLQIWTVSTLTRLVREHGFDVVTARRHRELTVRPSLYIEQAGYQRAGRAARLLDPVVERLWPIRNKLTLYARANG